MIGCFQDQASKQYAQLPIRCDLRENKSLFPPEDFPSNMVLYRPTIRLKYVEKIVFPYESFKTHMPHVNGLLE